ncbi:DUF21 domain-containing protein At1g47330-like isoform X2 [Macadamia integrifolia]|uniref:DUF21 domain-containing protein At1g47330-like isoform X2 n=1 Tax=Macadamia integrifolia TaxID=60698 RepID=UPI001C4FCD9F|nr:DUF21 domain-containing protein At1g47330-like isoform X2 [Macadamia integrifolia]
MAANVQCCDSKFALYLLVIVGLVCFAGLMAGLTLGLMSLGLVDLEVLRKSGRPKDRIYAEKIFPVVKRQHLLLCTLLIGNSLAMEALPIFMDALVPPWAAVVISVTLILMFGEILPQAVCTRYGMAVGAWLAPLVRVLLLLFFPVAYPISKAGKGGDLTHDETTIIAGALEMTAKTAKDAMTPISNAFLLDLDDILDLETLNTIMTKGHSRVPIYTGNPSNIIGVILVKNLLTVDPEDAVPLRKMLIRRIPRVSENMPLYDILNEFQKGHSHIAVVVKHLNETKETPKKSKEEQNMESKVKNRKQSAPPGTTTLNEGVARKDGDQKLTNRPATIPVLKKGHRGCSHCILDLGNAPLPDIPPNQEVVGVIAMEDVIEELLQEEILDETDEYIDIHNRIKVNMQASQGKGPNAASLDPNTALPSIACTSMPTLQRL